VLIRNPVLFTPQRVVATPGALEALERTGEEALIYLHKHVTGIQGALDDEDHARNQDALLNGGRIFSSYLLKNGTKLWVITEHDRSITTILLPSEY
jgi:hypothetical protein